MYVNFDNIFVPFSLLSPLSTTLRNTLRVTCMVYLVSVPTGWVLIGACNPTAIRWLARSASLGLGLDSRAPFNSGMRGSRSSSASRR